MLIPRDITVQVQKWMFEREILLLLGARQVGKTSILKLLMQDLKGQPVFYFDLENTFDLELCAIPEHFTANLLSRGASEERLNLCFIDEIQYHPDPTKFLKLIHDHYPWIKLIVTGSSSFGIRKKFRDALTGRKQVFAVYPLNFKEFLKFKKSPLEEVKKQVNLRAVVADFGEFRKYQTLTYQMLPLWEEFMVMGGFPYPTLTFDTEMRRARLREIYNSYIQKDIKDWAHIDDVLQFNKLVNLLALQIGNLLKMEEVGRELRLPNAKLSDYLLLLENTFIVSRVRPYHTNRRKELTKMPKLFFYDNGLRNTSLRDYRPPDIRPDKGALAENLCFTELVKRAEEIYFWRTWDKKEVDFVLREEDGSLLSIEVKYTAQPVLIPSSLKGFIRHYEPRTAVVLTKDYMNVTKLNDTKVFFVPMWMM